MMNSSSSFLESNLVRLPGVELEVFEAGRANGGRPIVLCHGFPEHAYSWRFQIPALVEAGYHVLVPNQRGYGRSSCPRDVVAYGIEELAGDLVALLDHFDYERATFVGHDQGAMVVWGLAMLHPQRVHQIVNLALPYQERGERPWLQLIEDLLGSDNYFVHFNKQPGVADAVLEANTARFLGNLFRRNLPADPPGPGMLMIELALADAASGEPLLSERELAVFVESFEASGFRGSINWYRNLDRNWHALGTVDPVIRHPALVIHGDRDSIPRSERMPHFVPNVDVVGLDCGHWIQQERPEDTNRVILQWLERR